MIALKRPTDKSGKTARLILQLSQAVEMFDPLGERFNVPEHHRGRTTPAKFMPHATDIQPIVAEQLAPRDFLPHPIHENFRPAARQTSQPRRFQSRKNLPQRKFIQLYKMVNLGRAETMHVDLWKVGLQIAKQLFVPFQLELGMKTTLEQNLIAAEIDRLLNLLQ
jgi:hypothetical protein